MATLMGEFRFWTLKDDVIEKDTDIGYFRLYEKDKELLVDCLYLKDKRNYAEGRNITWHPKNKRPDRLRDTLKEFEDIMCNHKCVAVKWEGGSALQFVFNNGLISSIHLGQSGNIERITLDRYLVGKLISDHVVDVVLDSNFILISYVEPKLTFIHFNRQSILSAVMNFKKAEKLPTFDAKVSTIDLVSATGRRVERRLSVNSSKDLVIVWWHNAPDEVWPWTPINSAQDRTNILIYSLSGSKLEFLYSSRIDSELVAALFSQYFPNQLKTLEEKVTRSGEISVDICVYEVSETKFHCLSLTTVPLKGHIVTFKWSPAEDKLILSCSDNSLIIYDAHCHMTNLTVSQNLITELAWHHNGVLVFAASEKGQIQCFDSALTYLNFQISRDDILPSKVLESATYFRHPPNLSFIIWPKELPSSTCKIKSNFYNFDTLCIFYETGPLAFLKLYSGVFTRGLLSPFELICQYIQCGQVDEAICLLLSLDWNRQGDLYLKCLVYIVNHLLRKPLNSNSEAQLEAALGSFYSPAYVLSEGIIDEYCVKIGHLARRFFHHLLRFQRFEKAFLLAVDLGCHDLFMDIHYLARDKNETALAKVALRRAEQLDINRSTSSVTDTSSEFDDDLTEYSDESSEAPDETGQKFPLVISQESTATAENNIPTHVSGPDYTNQKVPLRNTSQKTSNFVNTQRNTLSYNWPNVAPHSKSPLASDYPSTFYNQNFTDDTPPSLQYGACIDPNVQTFFKKREIKRYNNTKILYPICSSTSQNKPGKICKGSQENLDDNTVSMQSHLPQVPYKSNMEFSLANNNMRTLSRISEQVENQSHSETNYDPGDEKPESCDDDQLDDDDDDVESARVKFVHFGVV